MRTARNILGPVAIAVAVSMIGVSPAYAGPKLTPDKTEELRAAAREKADGSGDLAAQADVLFRSGQELGDPELMLDGARRLQTLADRERSTEIAGTALEEAATALDVIHYLMDGDNYARTRWRPVASDALPDLRDRAETIRDELTTLIEVIEEERAAAAAAAAAAAQPKEEEKKKRGPAKPGTGLIAGGAGMIVLGAGGLGLMSAGLAIGADTQKQAEGLDLPAQLDELDRLDKEGARANLFAYVGGAVAAVGIGVGLGLVIAGAKKRKGTSDSKERETAWIMLIPRATGATITGRF